MTNLSLCMIQFIKNNDKAFLFVDIELNPVILYTIINFEGWQV